MTKMLVSHNDVSSYPISPSKTHVVGEGTNSAEHIHE